jgi:hypothetical protein
MLANAASGKHKTRFTGCERDASAVSEMNKDGARCMEQGK